jgi:hypothetical protein
MAKDLGPNFKEQYPFKLLPLLNNDGITLNIFGNEHKLGFK